MIISASRRTDIPALYSEWFINRLEAGSIYIVNPWKPKLITDLEISPSSVECIVFWTKDPRGMLDKLDAIDKMGYRYYFLFTVNGYGNKIEKGLRDIDEIVRTFQELSRRIGRGRIVWRYDPVILNDDIDAKYHKKKFRKLCEELHNYTESCTISFVDIYPGMKADLVRPIFKNEMTEISGDMLKTADKFGIAVNACCEDQSSMADGIGQSSCIDKKIIERLYGRPLDIGKDRYQRKGCNCLKSTDIGAYNTCINGCAYCYANRSDRTAQKNFLRHDPTKGYL